MADRCKERAEAWCRLWQWIGLADDSYYEDCVQKETVACMTMMKKGQEGGSRG